MHNICQIPCHLPKKFKHWINLCNIVWLFSTYFNNSSLSVLTLWEPSNFRINFTHDIFFFSSSPNIYVVVCKLQTFIPTRGLFWHINNFLCAPMFFFLVLEKMTFGYYFGLCVARLALVGMNWNPTSYKCGYF